jgi:hypothetical protein
MLTVGCAITAYAQVIHNSANLYLGSDVEVHVDGSFSNSGFVQNQGDLYVSGDWTNTNVYQGLGRLTLDGTTTQRLSNNANSIYALRINSGGSVEWNDKLVVDKRLELLNGIVRIANPYSLTLAATATVAGGSTSSFVEGPLITRGTGYKFMPVGKAGGYYPVELLNVSGIDPVVQVEVFDQTPALRLDGYGRVMSSVYWKQSTLSGTYLGSPVSLGYDLPTDTDGVDIYQSTSVTDLFTVAANTSVSSEVGYDKVATTQALTGSLLVIGKPVVVAPGSEKFYFPTSLSPDAVNVDNRSVRVFGQQLTDDGFIFVVYNRWGQLVFESRSLEFMSENGWSGQQQSGGTVASGGYPYMLKGKLKSGDALEQKGMISVVR